MAFLVCALGGFPVESHSRLGYTVKIGSYHAGASGDLSRLRLRRRGVPRAARTTMSDVLSSVSGPATRDARLRDILADVVRRRFDGDTPPDAQVLAEHPELMPELAERLAALRRIEAARGARSQDPDETVATPVDGRTWTLDSAHADFHEEIVAHADLLEGYAIVREISRGGQGVVYEGLQEGTRRRVAIKVLHPAFSSDGDARRRFEREVELVASLRHPHIVSIFHVARTRDRRDAYVMDFVDGATLKMHTRGAERLRVGDALALFAQICDAVQFAHQNGIVHRDLKPSNILVDAAGEPRLLDFGLARPIAPGDAEQITLSEQIVGTLPYMSPEQTRGGEAALDTRSDVYSLGVILYEMLTGRLPYRVEPPLMDALRSIAETTPAPMRAAWSADAGVAANPRPRASRAIRPDRKASIASPDATSRGTGAAQRACPLDDEIETIVRKTLSKDRDRRYQSAGELGRDIRRYLAGEAVEAKRDSFAYIARKYVRRHAIAFAAGASLLAILACFGVYAALAYLDSRADQRARELLDAALLRESRHYQKLEAAARQWQLGWFLLEWRADRLDLARRIGDLYFSPMAHERAVVEYLLDPAMSFDELRARLPADAAALAHLAAGERALKAGDRAAALDFFRSGLADASSTNWWSTVLRDRIQQVEEPPSASPAGGGATP